MIEERMDLCPDAETLARGAAGELPLAERRAFVRHLSACDLCTNLVRLWPEAWSWAERAAAETRPGPPVGVRSWRSGGWLLAAAAALVVGVGLLSLRSAGPREAPAFRTSNGPEIRSLLPPERPLPRNAFRLRWTSGPPGWRYTVLVSREDLTRIARAQGLTTPEFLVEESLLRNLPSGTRIVWAVEASVPGETPAHSPVFVTALE